MGFFSPSERNGPTSFPPLLFRDLRKRINHGYQGTVHPLQLSVLAFFCFRLQAAVPLLEALLSQLPNPRKRTPDPQQYRKKPTSGLVGHYEGIAKLGRNRYGVWSSVIVPEGRALSLYILQFYRRNFSARQISFICILSNLFFQLKSQRVHFGSGN